MSQFFRHLPWWLALSLTLYLGALFWETGEALKFGLTCLAPGLWLGLYWLGSNQAGDEAE